MPHGRRTLRSKGGMDDLENELGEGRGAALELVQNLDRMGKAAMSVLPVKLDGKEYLIVVGSKERFEAGAHCSMIDLATGKLPMKSYGQPKTFI